MTFSGILSPYAGNIDPGTPEGIKLYQKAVAIDCSDDERLVVTMETSTTVMSSLVQDSNTFCYGSTVHAVPIQVALGPDPNWTPPPPGAPPGTPAPRATPPLVGVTLRTGSILLDSTVSLNHVLMDAHRAWGNLLTPTSQAEIDSYFTVSKIDFKVHPSTEDDVQYERVRRRMEGDRMLNIVDKATLQVLKARQDLYTWRDTNGSLHFDGPVIIKLIVDSIKPSTKVQLLSLQHRIERARLSSYNNDVNMLLNSMEDALAQIKAHGGNYSDYTLRLFQAFLDDDTSKNAEFKAAIQREKTDWELGRNNVTAESVSLLARTVFNNLKGTPTTGGGNKWNALDPREQKLMALTAKLEKLKVDSNTRTGGTLQSADGTIPLWRKTYKGDQITHDGQEFAWCNKHSYSGNNGFSGLYFPHPHDHEQWQARKDAYRNRRPHVTDDKDSDSTSTNAATSSSGSQPVTGALKLKQSLKKVLMTKRGLSDQEFNDVWSDCAQGF